MGRRRHWQAPARQRLKARAERRKKDHHHRQRRKVNNHRRKGRNRTGANTPQEEKAVLRGGKNTGRARNRNTEDNHRHQRRGRLNNQEERVRQAGTGKDHHLAVRGNTQPARVRVVSPGTDRLLLEVVSKEETVPLHPLPPPTKMGPLRWTIPLRSPVYRS